MAKRTPAPNASVTGVATGSLGTGTALDDTQVYSVDALAAGVHPDDVAPESFAHEAFAFVPHAAPAVVAPHELMPVVVPRSRTQPLQRTRHVTGGYPVGVLTAAVVALIAVAAVLTMRDGGRVSDGSGIGAAGAASFPPAPSFGPVETAAPAAEPTTGHHGHGHGHDR